LIFVLAGVATTLFLPVYRSYTLREHAKLAKAALEQLQAEGQVWQHQHPAQRWTFDDLGYAGQALYVSSDGTAPTSPRSTASASPPPRPRKAAGWRWTIRRPARSWRRNRSRPSGSRPVAAASA
jgi:hypothetical protein